MKNALIWDLTPLWKIYIPPKGLFLKETARRNIPEDGIFQQ
jgi:hypothetical protein